MTYAYTPASPALRDTGGRPFMGAKIRSILCALRRPATLRSHLIFLVLTAMMPLLVFAVVMIVSLNNEERATFERGATEQTRALLIAVDAELQSSTATLEALATSQHLDKGDLHAFYNEASRVIKSQPKWFTIILVSPTGQQVINIGRPFGADLPTIAEQASFDAVLRTGRPAVGQLAQSLEKRYAFAIRVPVIRSGHIKYVLTAVVDPQSISQLLLAQRLPPDWIGVVLDTNRRFVARTVKPETNLGQSASDSLRAALDRAPEGWFYGKTIEGRDVYTPYVRSPSSGWTVAIGIPAAVVEASLRRSFLAVTFFGLILLVLGIALAWYFGSRTARSIKSLSRIAEALRSAEGTGVPTKSTDVSIDIAEVESVRQALLSATELIRQRSDQRNRLEQALREANRRKDEFLSVLGHELRNPLGVISTVVQLLQSDGLADRRFEEYRETIEVEVKQMARLLDDLLDVSRIAHGVIRLRNERCDFAAIVRQVAESRRSVLQESGLDLSLHLPGPPLCVMGDRTRLAQIVGNLLDNANKFTDSGGQITVRLTEEPAGKAALSVRDTGIGMEPETLAAIFEPFVQAKQSLDRNRGGLGLGLALVKGLVELQGGEVGARSDGPQRGSEFTVRFSVAGNAALALKPSRPAAMLTHCRILIIEDNVAAAQSLKTFLLNSGHTVELALSGSDGLVVAGCFEPEVVLCDIGLPELDGYAVARLLRQEPKVKDAYLIAVSGYGRKSDQKLAMEAGFDTYLTKPIDLQELQRLLGELDCAKQVANI
jgi:signal transduction histidine kinase/ActR/RegA family two-component response regulator